MMKQLTKFREKFVLNNKKVLQWFPGHMNKGLKQIEKNLKNVDCLIEIHDARIPFSGRNNKFKYLCATKPHILVFNKKDLADLNNIKDITSRLQNDANRIIYTNCKDQKCEGISKIVPTTVELISKSERYNRSEQQEYSLMILGVPNVGKSSLINILRHKYLKKGRATTVGAVAGITRSLMTRIKVHENPPIYLLDTPGILTPNIPNLEDGLKLALVSSMQDHLVGPQIIADYLLFWLNKNNNFIYVDYLGLKEPSDIIVEVLILCAVKLNKTIKRRSAEHGQLEVVPDLDSAAYYFINSFRRGKFGKVMLD